MIAPIYTSLLSIFFIFLSINVIKGRRELGVGLGDKDCIEMKRRIRAQANFAEYTPFFLILLGYAEYSHFPYWILHLFGLLFFIGRIMHAYSVLLAEKYDGSKLTSNPVWRIRGMMCTFSTIGLLAIFLLIKNIIFKNFLIF